jgi:ribosomal protein S18 acetylase RimI-like enzyme
MVTSLFTAPNLRRRGVGRILLRQAVAEARVRGQRAVLDVGQRLRAAIGLYQSEGWNRVAELHEPLGQDGVLDLYGCK